MVCEISFAVNAVCGALQPHPSVSKVLPNGVPLQNSITSRISMNYGQQLLSYNYIS